VIHLLTVIAILLGLLIGAVLVLTGTPAPLAIALGCVPIVALVVWVGLAAGIRF